MSDQLTIEQILSRGVAEVLPGKDTLAKLMQEKKLKVYLGIDPTGSLLTLGHSVVLRKLQQFAELGHDVILLIGNGTVRIGDPTGRDSTRPVLTDEIIEENFKNWQSQASKILDFSRIRITHNGDWLDKLTYADLVKLMAQTTVQQLIERDMFQDRLKKGLPIHGHEIMYPLLQGYDSVAMDVDLELGGTDQTFNMMMGRHLQQVYNHREKWVLTTPIINGTDGRKMSKSYNNFVALVDEPDTMYGKLMSTTDDMIIPYFTLLTDVAEKDIATIQTDMMAGQNPMQFKKQLAYTITKMYHTAEAAQAAQEYFEKTVQQKEIPDDVTVITLPTSELSILELVKLCRQDETNSNLRRLIEQGGVELMTTNERPTDPFQIMTIADGSIIRIGKRSYFKLTVK
jgi:tyrosyl-tRNA synthetase